MLASEPDSSVSRPSASRKGRSASRAGSSHGGLANRYLGPHGDAITMGLLGALLLGWGVWLLVKEARKAKAIRKEQTAIPYKARR